MKDAKLKSIKGLGTLTKLHTLIPSTWNKMQQDLHFLVHEFIILFPNISPSHAI